MKITPKILSIPPYISTSWQNIASIHVENISSSLVLVVSLLNGTRIEIPHLEPIVLEAIFSSHARFIEQNEKSAPSKSPPKTPMSFIVGGETATSLEFPFKNGFLEVQGLGTILEHNPEQADSPDLPKEVLEKISELTKSMGIDDVEGLPKPEPHCNCMRCQITKAMHGGASKEESTTQEETEEIVTEEDLKFKNWDVKQTDDKLYAVTNPLETKEQYTVYLGDPLGCTCGQKHCEHVRAVLDT